MVLTFKKIMPICLCKILTVHLNKMLGFVLDIGQVKSGLVRLGYVTFHYIMLVWYKAHTQMIVNNYVLFKIKN
jgi:hypothetical protein